MAFGRRKLDQPASVEDGKTRTAIRIWYGAVFAACSPFVATYIWINFYKVPMERPFNGLFSTAMSDEGWAPVWAPPLVAYLLSFWIGYQLFKFRRWERQPIFWSGASTVVLGVIMASFVKNVGYVLFVKPDVNPVMIITALPNMLLFNTAKGVFELIFWTPVLLLLTPVPFLVAELLRKFRPL